MFIKSYQSKDIKSAIDVYSKVRSFRKAAAITKTSKSTIQRWWTSFHFLFGIRTKLQRKKKTRKRKEKYPNICTDIRTVFETKGNTLHFFTLQEIKEALQNISNNKINPSISWLHYCLKRAKVSRND